MLNSNRKVVVGYKRPRVDIYVSECTFEFQFTPTESPPLLTLSLGFSDSCPALIYPLESPSLQFLHSGHVITTELKRDLGSR